MRGLLIASPLLNARGQGVIGGQSLLHQLQVVEKNGGFQVAEQELSIPRFV